MATVVHSDVQMKRTLRDLVGGREVPEAAALAAFRWIRADASIIETANGGVRLRVPVVPRAVKDVRAR